MKRVFAMLLCAMMVAGMMAGCTQNQQTSADQTTQQTATEETKEEEKTEETSAESSEIKAPEKDVEMQYISVEDATKVLDSDDYTFLDVRKAEDHKTSCVPGSVGVDMDAAKGGDFQAGVTAMQPIVDEHDDNLVIICYSGKSYAQATTNVLSALGYDMSKVYTLEGGFTKWSETYPDQIEK